MQYMIRAIGVERAVTRFDRMGSAAIDASSAMEVVADMMMEFIRRNFESQGRRGGGSWRKLTNEWLTQKQREGLDPRIGFATHDLFYAFTWRFSPDQHLVVTPHSAEISSHLPQAAPQQEHRPFARFNHRDILEMREFLREYLIRAWRVR